MAKSQYANWYADRRWRRIREQHLAREPLCRYCQQKGRITVADVVDHIEPHRGDRQKFWYGERQSLCHECHSGTKQREEAGQMTREERRRRPGDHWSR